MKRKETGTKNFLRQLYQTLSQFLGEKNNLLEESRVRRLRLLWQWSVWLCCL